MRPTAMFEISTVEGLFNLPKSTEKRIKVIRHLDQNTFKKSIAVVLLARIERITPNGELGTKLFGLALS